MAVALRCPECRAKLKFDDDPAADEAVECERCGHQFLADEEGAAAPKKKRRPIDDDDEGNAPPKKKKKKAKAGGGNRENAANVGSQRRMKKKKSNKVILVFVAVAALVFLPLVGYVGYKAFFTIGKVPLMLTNIPGDCNLIRGVDIDRVGKYPGYKAEFDKVMSGPFAECQEQIAKAAGKEPVTQVDGKPVNYFDYAMAARKRAGGVVSVAYIFNTLQPFDATAVFATGLGGKPETVDGVNVYRIPASRTGAMSSAAVYCPSDRIIVLVPKEGNSEAMLKACIAAKADKSKSIIATTGATGNRTTRAHVWTLMRDDGDLKGRINSDVGEPIKAGLPEIAAMAKKSKVFGSWIFFGQMIKFGAGFECDSTESASGLAKAMREGKLSHGDDSEVPRDLKLAFHPSGSKDFSEFLSNLKFESDKEYAYFWSKVNLQKAMYLFSTLNRPSMWELPPAEGRGR